MPPGVACVLLFLLIGGIFMTAFVGLLWSVATRMDNAKSPRSRARRLANPLDDLREGEAYFFTKIVGVTFDNEDRTNRQSIIARCKAGEYLQVLLEPQNLFDSKAVAVRRLNGERLGYLTDLVKEVMSDRLRKGDTYRVRLIEITGGTPGKPTLGANLLVCYPLDRRSQFRELLDSLQITVNLDDLK